MGPLSGIRVLEFAGLGPTPFCGMLLSDLGADVVRIGRPADVGANGAAASTLQIYATHALGRGRRSIAVDLKSPEGIDTALELVRGADALVEGFRPGVMERLGLGPEECTDANPRLVYARMTGWGQTGAKARTAGHDINYVAQSGVLATLGRDGEPPVAPLNLIGDFGGGGALMAFGITAALLEAQRSGTGQVVETAMLNGSALLMTMMYELLADGVWSERRGDNLIDGAAPFYGTYETADHKYIAVGAMEPQFYRQLLDRIGLEDQDAAGQWDRATWPATRARIAEQFRRRTRAEWVATLADSDACATPVLQMTEALADPDNADVFLDVGGVRQPGPVPSFSRTRADDPRPARAVGADTDVVLLELGLSPQRIAELRANGSVA